MKRNVPKEIKWIARERVGRVKTTRVIVPKIHRDPKYPDPPIENTIQTIACQRCAGSGFLACVHGRYDCPRCEGTGHEPG
jgi:hypothetical protein